MPRRTYAVPPQGARLRSNQSHADLLARRMLDLDRRPTADPPARLAVGPQARCANAADEARVAARVAELPDLVEQGGQPEMGIVGEAGGEIRRERFERIRDRRSADAGGPVAADVGADRLAVAFEVAGDG